MDIPERCRDCPLVKMDIELIEKARAKRSHALDKAKSFMVDQENTEGIIEELEQQGEAQMGIFRVTDGHVLVNFLIEGYEDACKETREDIEGVFDIVDETIEFAVTQIGSLVNNCENGSQTTRRYWLFGEEILICSSKFNPRS